MKGQNIEIDGLNELIAAFKDLPADAIDELTPASIKAANVVTDRARKHIHDRTGDLSRGLKVWPPGARNKKKYQVIARVGFGKGAMHGVPLELGHGIVLVDKSGKRHGVGVVQERPFLRPAADESKQETQDAMVGAINKAIDALGGKK